MASGAGGGCFHGGGSVVGQYGVVDQSLGQCHEVGALMGASIQSLALTC